MVASTLEGVVGETIEATVMLLVAGDERGPMVLGTTGDGVLSMPGDW
jgi:hypothetical protein